MTSVNKIPQYIVACCVLHNICERDVCNEPLPEICLEERAIRGPVNDLARTRAANSKGTELHYLFRQYKNKISYVRFNF